MMNERTLELFTVIAGDGFTGRVALDATRWAIPDDPPQRRAIVVLRPEHAEAPFLPNIVVEVRPVVGVIDPGVGVPPELTQARARIGGGSVRLSTASWGTETVVQLERTIEVRPGADLWIGCSALDRQWVELARDLDLAVESLEVGDPWKEES